MITQSSFVIAVPDLAISAAFYQDVLEFTVMEMGDPGWRFYQKGACRIMAGECPDALPPHDLGDHSYFAYLQVESTEELEAFHRRLAERGVELVKMLRDEPWGMREFGVRTADGHRIMFGAVALKA